MKQFLSSWKSVLGLAIGFVLIVTGRGGERQFCPKTFEHRGVDHFCIPYTDIVILSLPGKPYRCRIAKFWISEGYINVEGREATSWHTITRWVPWERLSSSGNAKRFWSRAGCHSDASAEDWITWSREHPKLAAALWPRVVGHLEKAADRRQSATTHYLAAAQLMPRVQGVTEETQYRERVQEWCQEVVELMKELDSIYESQK